MAVIFNTVHFIGFYLQLYIILLKYTIQ
jgi:hypothetical protein